MIMRSSILTFIPIDDSFPGPKEIVFPRWGLHVKIGRDCGPSTIPDDRHVYFDSKVLSRQHAEVWEELGKICIKDTVSANGTFVNGSRLSTEEEESGPVELHSGDTVILGVDIFGGDKSTIIHHKISACVVLE
ncbi:hypothetical protein FRB96_006833 [Tulasnella sp. 330]|nr:hypothetical protein FRB96_006833 [Tulasnella sp. 330]KAG8872989.1 hypothetical protein FRB97_007136 [Tulasnella sp. 331]KAG8876610.1 hypothetical protein FRB98_007112 [Tulasnella sp. 332]